MVGVSLLIDEDEAGVNISASRGIDTFMHGVIPHIVDTTDTLELGYLLARFRVENNQQRRGASGAEKPMMGLVERQSGNEWSAGEGPACHLFGLHSINPTHLGYSSKSDEYSGPRFLDLDATGAYLRLDISDMFIAVAVDDSQLSQL